MFFVYISPEGTPNVENKDEEDGITLVQKHFDIIKNDYSNANYFLGGIFRGTINARKKQKKIL